MKRRPLNFAWLNSPWESARAVVMACLLLGCLPLFPESSWKHTLRQHLPPDARDVRFGGSSDLLADEGVCAFSSSPAALDKLASSDGFVDVTNEVTWPDGDLLRANLDKLGRKHVGQPLDSLGTVKVFQKILRYELTSSRTSFL
jgi:hypothetical protein